MDGQMTEHQATEAMNAARQLSYCFNTSRLWIDREDLVGAALMATVKCHKRWNEDRGPFDTYVKSVMYYAMLEKVRTLTKTRKIGTRKYQIPFSQMAVDGKYNTLVSMISGPEEPNMFELQDELEFWKRFFNPSDWLLLHKRYMEYKCDREIGEDLDRPESTINLRRNKAVSSFQSVFAGVR